jgi:RNA polymerase sigma-70 factor (ECF subfamily)
VVGFDEHPDPEKLLARARDGDPVCVGALLEVYRNYLCLLARTQIDMHLRGRFSPSDVVQEVFLRAFRAFASFRGGGERELMAWLRRILANTLARLAEHQAAGKRNPRREVSIHHRLRESSATFEAALVSPHSSPSSRARRRESAARVADLLARMPPDYREILVLRNLEGLPFPDVAARMGRTPGAVRVLWLRALDRLRQLLGAEESS